MIYLEQILAAGLCCALLALLVWAGRRGKLRAVDWIGSTHRATFEINVVARKALTPQHAIHVLSVGGQRFLLATHPAGVELLAPRPVGR